MLKVDPLLIDLHLNLRRRWEVVEGRLKLQVNQGLSAIASEHV